MHREPISIMVVEDDYFAATDLKAAIESNGDFVVGPFADVHDAISRTGLAQAAILDIKLGEENSFLLAESLICNEIPFVFLSGYDRSVLSRRLEGQKLYNKPVNPGIILADLHLRYAEREDQRQQPTIELVVIKLMEEARLLMPDAAAAERLVAAVLRRAINDTEAGIRGLGTLVGLREILLDEHYRRANRYLV